MKENRLLLKFFLLTFAISWVFWIPAVVIYGTTGLNITNVFQNPRFVLLQTLGAISPSLSAYILIRKYYGKTVLSQIINSYKDWKIKVKWYLVSIFLFPTIAFFSILVNKYFLNTAFAIDPGTPVGNALASYGAIGTFIFLIILFCTQIFSSPLFEELGWRGFALPILQKKYSALLSAIIIGLIWGLWHLPLTIAYGSLSFIYYFNFIAYSILMTWIFNNTKGNMLLMLLFHASLNISMTYLDFGQPKWIYFLFSLLILTIVTARSGTANLSKKMRIKFADL